MHALKYKTVFFVFDIQYAFHSVYILAIGSQQTLYPSIQKVKIEFSWKAYSNRCDWHIMSAMGLKMNELERVNI
jgi:hypothetical protein